MPINNNIKAELEALSKVTFPSFIIDTEMSDTSTNAVENRVIKSYVDRSVANTNDKLEEVDDQLEQLNNIVGQLNIPTRTSQLENNGDGDSPFATIEYVSQNGGKVEAIKINGEMQPIDEGVVNIDVPDTSKIDEIKVNGIVQVPINKSVDITVPTSVDELTGTDKYVKTDGINKNVVTTVNVAETGNTVGLEIQTQNLLTGENSSETKVLPVASTASNGLMPSTAVTALGEITERVEALEGKATRLLYITSNNPSASQINEFITGLGYESPFNGVSVVVNETHHIWHYYENNGIGWKDDGVDIVSNFTDSAPGIIKGASLDRNEKDAYINSGKIHAEADGTGSVVGWNEIHEIAMSDHDEVNRLTAEISDLTQNQKDMYTKEEADVAFVTVSGDVVQSITGEKIFNNFAVQAPGDIRATTIVAKPNADFKLEQVYGTYGGKIGVSTLSTEDAQELTLYAVSGSNETRLDIDKDAVKYNGKEVATVEDTGAATYISSSNLKTYPTISITNIELPENKVPRVGDILIDSNGNVGVISGTAGDAESGIMTVQQVYKFTMPGNSTGLFKSSIYDNSTLLDHWTEIMGKVNLENGGTLARIGLKLPSNTPVISSISRISVDLTTGGVSSQVIADAEVLQGNSFYFFESPTYHEDESQDTSFLTLHNGAYGDIIFTHGNANAVTLTYSAQTYDSLNNAVKITTGVPVNISEIILEHLVIDYYE